MPNPTYAKVQEGAKLARENHVDLILAVGGGSVSDCCKVVSAQAKLDEDLWELENTKHIFPSDLIPLGTITAQVWQSSIRRCTGTSALRMRAVSPALPGMSGASTRPESPSWNRHRRA